MANVYDLLNAAASQPINTNVQTPVSPTPANVDLYQAAAGIGTDRGMSSASEMEQDLRTLAPNAFAAKYGREQAASLFAGLQSAGSQFSSDVLQSNSRNALEATGDTATGVVSGFANSIYGPTVAGLGMLDAEAGTKGAKDLETANNWLQSSLQSTGVNAARRANAGRTGLDFRDNEAEAKRSVDAGGSELSAQLKRMGKDAYDTIVTGGSDSTLFVQGTSDAVGSLLAGGPISKGLKAVGSGVLKAGEVLAGAATRSPGAVASLAARVGAVGDHAAMPLAIGAMEGGGAYQQTAADVMGMNFDDLSKKSPKFDDLVKSGLTKEEARIQLANDAGLTAAAIQAPIAAATGALVSKFEADPFKVPSLRAGLANVLLKEPIEEGVQSATGQLAQNYAVQQNADRTQQLADGVGEQIGMGALYGFGAAGAVQGPGLARRATIEGGRATYRGTKKLTENAVSAGQPLFAAIADRADRITKQQEKAGPVSDDVVRAATADLIQNQQTDIPAMQAAVEATDATPEQKTQASEYITKLGEALQFDASTEGLDGLPESGLKTRLFESTDRVDAVQQTARAITEATTREEQLQGLQVLNHLMSQIDSVKDADPEALYSLPQGPERDAVNRYAKLVNQIENTPAMRNALEKIRNIAQQGEFDNMAPATTEQEARQIVAVADTVPDRGNPAAIESVLKMAAAGTIQLTPVQMASLRLSGNLIRERQQQEADIAASGLQSAKDVVSSEIVASNDPLKKYVAPSARQHAARIVNAMKSGDVEKAAAFNEDFGLFVQHMQNKVDALNKSFANGGEKMSYQALAPQTREWFDSAGNGKALHKRLWVDTRSDRSLDLAQAIGSEAKTLASVYNNIVETFPEFGQKTIQPVELNSDLIGKPSDLISKFASPKTQTSETESTREVAQQPVEEVSAQKSEAETVANVAPVESKEETTPAKPEENTTTMEVVEKESATPKISPPAKSEMQADSTQKTNTIKAAFPDLHSDTLSKTFTVGKEVTRIFGDTNPVALVQEALMSADSLREFVGDTKLRHTLTPELAMTYQNLLESVPDMIEDGLSKNLTKFFAEKNNRERFLNGVDLINFDDGKSLALVENVDGELKFNEALMRSGTLAATQWLLTGDNFGQRMGVEEVAALLGVEEADVSQRTLDFFQQGLSLTEAKNSLANLVKQFWGMQARGDALKGFTDGIPEAFAAEMLESMIDAGLVKKNTDTVPDELAELTKQKGWTRYLTPRLDANAPIKAYPTAIQDAVLHNPPEVLFLGDAIPPTPTTQMNNPDVDLTADQMDAITKESKIPYQANVPLLHFYAAMGKDGFVNGFAAGDLSDKRWNQNTAASLKGRNNMAEQSFDSVFDVAAAMANSADGKIGDATIRYGYNMSRVGRMQMLGKHNPQSNKFMREVVLPTWSELDMNNGDHQNMFDVAVAQHIGLKIHKLGMEQTVVEMAAKKIDPDFKAVTDYLADWINKTDFNGEFDSTKSIDVMDIKQLMTKAGLPMTPGALHAVFELARASTIKDGKIRTGLYIEADGVTNGPINAMLLMTPGEFTKEWVENVQKGGIAFGVKRAMNQLDSKDMYETSTDKTFESFQQVVQQMAQQKNKKYVLANTRSLINIMALMLPDVNIKDGVLTLKRGIAKNPLTITIYGSGEKGIAGKLTEMVMEEFYSKLSEMAQNQDFDSSLSNADAMFYGDADAQAKYDMLMDAVNTLTSSAVHMSKRNGDYYRRESEGQTIKTKGKKSFAEEFTLTGEAKTNFEQNMLEIFVKPMREGIAGTVGKELFVATKSIQKATDVQSIVMQSAYQEAIEARIEERKKEDPNYSATNFLSQNDLTKIKKDMQQRFPLVESDAQKYLIAKSARISDDRFNYSKTLNGQMRTPANYFAPTKAGVMGIAALTIGSGDGMMMQHIAQKDLGTGLKVFDGWNVPLDRAQELNTIANEAVYQSMQGNPLAMVAESFGKFVDNAETELNKLSDDALAEVGMSVFGKTEEPPTVADIVEGLNQMKDQLDKYGREAAARHTAMTKVAMSVDQMAATESPFHNGVESDIAMTSEEAAAALNIEYEKALNRPKRVRTPDPLDMGNYGRTNKTGVRILSQTSLKQLLKDGHFTEAQKTIMGEIMRSGAAKDFTLVAGTPEQIANYQAEKGLTGIDYEDGLGGYAVIGEQMIYLFNPTGEIITHELIHASSYSNVLAVYDGVQTDPVVREAVNKLEAMMDRFMADDTVTIHPVVNERIADAKAAINDRLTSWDMTPAESKAGALNEFMAYGLSVQGIADGFKKSPGLFQMVKDVVKQIKNVIWGRKKAPAIADDFLSQLQFNSAIIIRSQPSLMNQITNATLYHRSTGSLTERQAGVRTSFANSVAAMFTREGLTDVQARNDPRWADAQKMSTQISNEMAGRFDLNPAEASTLNMVVAALATEARLDSNALNRAQELYTHVTKNLKVEDLMDPNAADYNVELHYAQQRFNAVLGKDVRGTDNQNRTTMLSGFIGLSLVSDRMRAALKDMELPKSSLIEGDSLDVKLSNLGTKMLDGLTDRMAGTKNTTTVLGAMDALTDRLSEIAANETDFVQQNALGNAVDNVNNWMTNALTVASDAGVVVGEKLATTGSNKATRAMGRMLQIVSGMATEKNGAAVAEGFMDVLNKHKVPDFMFQLANDIVGRTDSNAAVYDMIKKVRANSQQLRQEFRKEVPKVINSTFTRALNENEKAVLHKALGRTDIAALADTMTAGDIADLFGNSKKLADQIKDQSDLIKNEDGKRWNLYDRKAKQLARYITTGIPGTNLLRNAYAIASLANESILGRKLTDDGIKALDRLATLYAIDGLSKVEKDTMADLLKTEKAGLEFSTNYLTGQRKGELSKVTNNMLRMNHFKGYIPSMNKVGSSLEVGLLSDAAFYEAAGYKQAGTYYGSNVVRGDQRAYYVADVPEKASFAQGIMQNVRHTVSGVDANTGYTTGLTAGRITNPTEVKRITARLMKESVYEENLSPVFDATGQVIAYEETLAPAEVARLRQPADLAEMVGVWRGRQVEEKMSDAVNRALIDKLHNMYDPKNKDGFINLADSKQLDKVQFDATKLFTPETVQYMQQKFGNDEFWVRKDLVDDVIGYRNATIGDFASGNTRWSKATQDVVRNLLINTFGADVMPKLIKAEQMIQGVVSDIRTHIVVKSVIVPAYNFMSNMYQLMSRGVPVRDIVGKVGAKTAEINAYVKSRERQIEVEALLRAEQDPLAQRRLRAEIRSITDSHARMSIAPLIAAGEFSTIADIGASAEDLQLSSGKLMTYIETQVDKLPKGLQTAARYGLVSRDTALFQGLQKAVQYGDFIAKATLYDDLVKRKGLSSEAALARITEEFVNYDRLPGRNRGYLENIGMLWFYNFKLRIAKIALSTLRNNPLHGLIAMAMPNVQGVGLPVQDNVFTKAFEGTLGYSIGPGMAFNAPTLNPWYNMTN